MSIGLPLAERELKINCVLFLCYKTCLYLILLFIENYDIFLCLFLDVSLKKINILCGVVGESITFERILIDLDIRMK